MSRFRCVGLLAAWAGFAFGAGACGSATLNKSTVDGGAGAGGSGGQAGTSAENHSDGAAGSFRDGAGMDLPEPTDAHDGATKDGPGIGSECRAGNGQCIASMTGFALGIEVAATSTCPSGFSTSQTLYAGLIQTGACTCGACAPGAVMCQATVSGFVDHDDFDCTGAFNSSGVINNNLACASVATPNGADVIEIVGTTPAVATCTPGISKSTLGTSWTSTLKFCQADFVQSDCQNGICLAGGNPCVLSAGDVSCPVGFTKIAGPLYSGSTIDQRACACSCTNHGGDCAGVTIAGSSDPSCTGTDAFDPMPWPAPGVTSACLTIVDPNLYVTVAGLPTAATCTGSSSVTGTGAQPTGMQTLCCAQ
jgi:hypothetical protein